jgi:hypothetical protein
MATSEARIEANRRNSQLSTGPKTDEGKAQSRANSLKHGMTGAGIVLPESEVDEVETKFEIMTRELKPTTELGIELVRRIATLMVRLKRSQDQETAHLSARVRQARDEFVPPEGASPAESEKLRAQAGDRALFDPSPEACLARKYEAAAERGFFRAIKEFRQEEAEARGHFSTGRPMTRAEMLGSFLPAGSLEKLMAPQPGETIRKPPLTPPKPAATSPISPVGDYFEVPIAIGKPR